MKWRLNMIKELFGNKKPVRVNDYHDLKVKAFKIGDRLKELDRIYATDWQPSDKDNLSDCKKPMPAHIKEEREALLRTLSKYERALERDSDRRYVRNHIFFWSWFFSRG